MNKTIKILWIVLISILCVEGLTFIFLYVFTDRSFTILGDNPYYLDYKGDFVDPGYKVSDEFKNKKVVIENNINSFILGDYTVNYKFNNKNYVRTVKVVDREKPVIKLKGNEVVTVCPNKKYVEEGYEVSDNFDMFLSDKVKIIDNGTNLKYEVTDINGNVGSVIRKIEYKDKEAPVIKTGKVIHFLNQSYNDLYSASDNCDGDITSKVKVSGSVDVTKLGTYELSYEITDSSGNKSTSTRSVLVVDKATYNGGIIYLTFDDGPSDKNTPRILDILKTNNIKATFFINDHGSSLDYLIKREVNEGHSVGNHTASHNYKTIYSSDSAFFNDLERLENKIINLAGKSEKIMRFPGGSSNTVSRNYNKGIMSRLTKQVEQKGYKYYDWNVGSGDTDEKKSASSICYSVTSNFGKGANIVLMHDRKEMVNTVDALPCIIEYGINHGYIFDKITHDTKSYHHYVSN